MENFEIEIYSPEQQGSGSFDNGKIMEIKPIDFPGGTSQAKRIGPLFYWSWATARGDGIIAMHPHKVFEIVSYVLEGVVGHSDSLENKTRVGLGGAQLIQAGSGIYHQEEMYGEVTDFFQIWFEPDIRETIKDEPNYAQIENEEFSVESSNGVTVKSVIGNDSPLQIKSDILANDITIGASSNFKVNLEPNTGLAFVVVEGNGKISTEIGEKELVHKDFIIITASGNSEIVFSPDGDSSNLRIFMIQMPTSVDYPLYGE